MEPPEERYLQTITLASAVSSTLSVIGVVYIIGRYWYARRLQSKSLSVYAGLANHLDVTKELVHIIACLDFFGAIGRAFGVLPTKTFDQNAGEPVTVICKLQASVITFGDGAPIAWNFIMALNLYRWICIGEDQQMLMKKIKWYIGGTLVFALSIPIICLSSDKYGDAGLWCWIFVRDDIVEEIWWMSGALYFWIVVGGVSMTVFLVLVKINMKKRLKTNENDDANDAYCAVVHNLTVYITGFILCWLPAVVDRAYTTFTGKTSFTLEFLHAAIVPLQGFINAVMYGKLHIWVVRHVREPWASASGLPTKNSKISVNLLRQSIQLREHERHIGTATIFVSTFDMNWTSCPTNLEDWIPAGKDLYVFSLQHCVAVQTIEQHIRGYLLQVNYPTAYRSITSIAGTAVRGDVQDASVCQIVFVNSADDASGNVKLDAVDGRIWAQRKTFNEVVGIPIRYFDASIAFVSCNLSTALVNNSQRPRRHAADNVFAKHAVASSLIHSFGMDVDRAAVDFPNLYHHTIISGNLNYDIDMSPSVLAAAIEQAYKATSLKRATDLAIDAQMKGVPKLEIASRSKKNNGQLDDMFIEEGREGWGRSMQRSSADASSFESDDSVYEEVCTFCEDKVSFTELKSPTVTSDQSSLHAPSTKDQDQDNVSIVIHTDSQEVDKHKTRMPTNWADFLDNHLPAHVPAHVPKRTERLFVSSNNYHRALNRLASCNQITPRCHKKIRDLWAKSDLVTKNTTSKWLEVLRYDELRASIDAKEIFTGFEEPPIEFLPSFPRKIGVAASFSMVGETSCKELFYEANEEAFLGDSLPAYKDRILAHSLSDTKQRIRNIGYWLCEDIVTSTHKPVCSIYELEIDRYFSYNMDEAAVADLRQGNHALRDKSGVHEFKIKLVKLDANIWTYEERHSGFVVHPTGHRRHSHESSHSSNRVPGRQSSRRVIISASTSSSGKSSRHSVQISMSRRKSSIAQVFGRVLHKSGLRSGTSSTDSRSTALNQYSDFPVRPTGARPMVMTNDGLSALATSRLELVPVEPVSISTIFPLPSEDVYALQRKVYEVAHLVQNGFQSSARIDGNEESQLAYTNFRTVAWKKAMSNGVTHSAITKAVNGGVHIAISIEAEKGHGGQGVLCLKESDLMNHAAPVLAEAVPIPFDVTLTWGGKHVGYLHGDILCST